VSCVEQDQRLTQIKPDACYVLLAIILLIILLVNGVPRDLILHLRVLPLALNVVAVQKQLLIELIANYVHWEHTVLTTHNVKLVQAIKSLT